MYKVICIIYIYNYDDYKMYKQVKVNADTH